MTDVPDDLTSEGTHRGNEPPADTGRTVRSPEGPDPGSGSANEAPALFQLMTEVEGDSVRVRIHPPRRMVDTADEGYEELAQVYTPDDLRKAVEELPADEYHIVYEAPDRSEVRTETARLDNASLYKPTYDLATLFQSSEAASEYVDSLESSASSENFS